MNTNSKKAFEKAKKETNESKLLDLYKRHGEHGLTDDEIHNTNLLNKNSYRATRLALMKKGKVKATGENRKSNIGNDMQVYVYIKD